MEGFDFYKKLCNILCVPWVGYNKDVTGNWSFIGKNVWSLKVCGGDRPRREAKYSSENGAIYYHQDGNRK